LQLAPGQQGRQRARWLGYNVHERIHQAGRSRDARSRRLCTHQEGRPCARLPFADVIAEVAMDSSTNKSDTAPDTNDFAPLDVEALRRSLAGLRLGNPLVYVPALGSTNSQAMELAHAGAAEGTLVITDHQTAGRGRVGRVWEPLPRQQLTFSLLLRPPFAPHWLVMASALAVAAAIEAVTGIRPEIKWPNDVLIGGLKVCGILIETSDGVAVLGIGVNVNGSLAEHPLLATRATTLADAAGHILAREPLAAEIIQELDARYAELLAGGEAAQSELRTAWRARLVTLGRRVVVRQGEGELIGIAEDVAADGALLLRDEVGGQRVVTWGDVE